MNLTDTAREIRKKILKVAFWGGSGHIATSLSAVEILVQLYFGQILRYDVQRPEWEERDRFILSKGHGSLLLYNVLAKAGYFPFSELEKFCQPGTIFGSHPTVAIPGVEATTGALGHGYSYAVGVALAAKIDRKDYLTFVLLGDGECQEGSVWEAAASVATYNLNNLITVVDFNGIQATDYTSKISRAGDFNKRWEAWGFEVLEIDGNNLHDVEKALSVERNNLPLKPRVVIAHTVKGKGIPMMENNPQWHSRIPTDEELYQILLEIGMSREEFDSL